MSRLSFAIAAGVFLLFTLVGTAIPTLVGTAAAQNSSQPVTKDRRMPYPSFELEVIVDGRPLREYTERGRTYVEALRGAEYELRLRNSSPDRVAVALAVDGLNTIDAQHASAWESSKWVMEPYQTITINGWQMSSERARRFYFTDERDSYAAKLGQTANLGVISAVFFRERGRRPIPITREPSTTSSDVESSGSPSAAPKIQAELSRSDRAATGIGRSVRHDVYFVNFELEPRPVADLKIRYEFSREGGRFCPEPK